MSFTSHDLVVFAAGFSILAPILAALTLMAKRFLRNFTRWAIGLIIVSQELESGITPVHVRSFLLKESSKSWTISKKIFSLTDFFVKSEDKYRAVAVENRSDVNCLVFYKKAFIYLGKPSFDDKGNLDILPCVSYLRWTVNWKQLLTDVCKLRDDRMDSIEPGKKFRIIRHIGYTSKNDAKPAAEMSKVFANTMDEFGSLKPINYDPSDLGRPVVEDPISALSITKEMAEIFRDARFWFRHRKWYEERGIAWRRGYLLYGLPGSGKTTAVRALAQDLDLPVHTFDLSSMDNDDLTKHWIESRTDGPRIILLEDIDTVFNGRKNVARSSFNGQKNVARISPLTFDTLLNLIDGIESEHGLMLFITTNNVDAVDPAIGVPNAEGESSRPGRVDMAINLPGLDYQGRLKMARRILGIEADAVKLAKKYPGLTAAQFQERAIKLALVQLWGEENRASDDEENA